MKNLDDAAMSTHRTFAKELFNRTWKIIGNASRREADTAEMIHTAHASRYHWHVLVTEGEGTPLNEARGDWLLARVYALAGEPLQASKYAERSRAAVEKHDLGAFDLAFAHEAIARAAALLGDANLAKTHLNAARNLVARIDSEGNCSWLLENLETIEVPD